MNKILLAIVLVTGIVVKSNGQTDSATKARQIINIEQLLADALPGDSLTWKKYLDPKWYITTEDGTGMFRKEFLAGFSPFPKGVSGNIKVVNPIISFHDNWAVIHYVADEHENFFGNNLHTTYGTVDTWYKTDTSWMMLSMLSFEIPQLPPAVKVDNHILEQYTGTYKLTDEKTASITLKNDTLFIQKNKGKPEALLPETNNVFFRMADTRGRKLFVKDDTGQMLMRERRNGQDVVWKRVK